MRKSLHKDSRYNQGKFHPKNIHKYKGSLPIIYRSGLELKAFRWMDNNPNIISWGSESVIIPYNSPIDLEKKVHRYFVDLVAHLKSKDGTIKKLLIEVKPHKQTSAPTHSPRKGKKTVLYEQTQFLINSAKWEAARAWCSKNDYTFIILTEKHLKD
jgi:hypothetical protein